MNSEIQLFETSNKIWAAKRINFSNEKSVLFYASEEDDHDDFQNFIIGKYCLKTTNISESKDFQAICCLNSLEKIEELDKFLKLVSSKFPMMYCTFKFIVPGQKLSDLKKHGFVNFLTYTEINAKFEKYFRVLQRDYLSSLSYGFILRSKYCD